MSLTEKVQKGELDGEVVWICHYNRPDLNKKPLRNVPPTKCLVVNNKDLPKGKRIYYSYSHFVKIGKNGSITKQVISPVDNTGYRSIQGNPLHTFRTEEECVEQWNKDLDAVHKQLSEKLKVVVKKVENEIIELEDMYL